jgi:hypothetical protein
MSDLNKDQLSDLKSIIKSEKITVSQEQFGGTLDPMWCDCCVIGAPACSKGSCFMCTTLTY